MCRIYSSVYCNFCCGRANSNSRNGVNIIKRDIWKRKDSFSCVCVVIDDEFRHNIVKVVVVPRDDSRVDLHTTFTML